MLPPPAGDRHPDRAGPDTASTSRTRLPAGGDPAPLLTHREDAAVAIDSSTTYPAPPAAVFALLTDEGFLTDRAAALGGEPLGVTVTRDGAGTETTARLTAPTAGIPTVFARFVGSSVTVTERTTWVPADDGGHRAALDVRAEVFGRTVRVTGERRLTPVAEGTRSTVTGDAQVRAPLIGRQAEGAVRELVTVVLRREEELLRRRLG